MKPKRHVLVIDDTPEDRTVIRRVLLADRNVDFSIEEASSGEEGTAACSRGGHDVVLLDLHLLGLDGLGVLRELRASGFASPVVVLTGSQAGTLANEALELGAVDFLVKDELTPTGLARAISNAIIRAALQRRLEESASRLARLVTLSTALSAADTQASVMDILLGEGLTAAAAATGFIALFAEDGRHLSIADDRGYPPDARAPAGLLPLEASLPACEAARTGQIVTCSTLAARDERYPLLRGTEQMMKALAALPLFAKDDVLGVLALSFSAEREFNSADLAFLHLLARVGGQALRRTGAQEGERRAKEQLAQTHELLKTSAGFEKHLIGIVSHDLKNPLQTILMQSQMMLQQDLSDSLRTGTARIERAARRSNELISDLLDFAKGRSGGGFLIARGKADLGELVAQAVEALRASHPARDIVLRAQGKLEGFWDRERLEQMITNLVANALQHGDAAAPVTVELREQEDHSVVLEVHNSGEPIDLNLMPQLFEPFGVGGGTRNNRNVGLGLFIVDQIVKAHEGSVQVSSTAAVGTRFVVHLPRDAKDRIGSQGDT